MMEMITPVDFWKWAYSDFMSNALRGVLAEYIVATAVHCTAVSRIEWNAFDLETPAGIRIEVKSAAYLQSWDQRSLSPIRFDIASKMGWDSKTNTNSKKASRSAQVYVFCVFASTCKASANPMDLGQWFFLVCATETINKRFGTQKSVSLSSLEKIGLQRITFESLAAQIEIQAIQGSEKTRSVIKEV